MTADLAEVRAFVRFLSDNRDSRLQELDAATSYRVRSDFFMQTCYTRSLSVTKKTHRRRRPRLAALGWVNLRRHHFLFVMYTQGNNVPATGNNERPLPTTIITIYEQSARLRMCEARSQKLNKDEAITSPPSFPSLLHYFLRLGGHCECSSSPRRSGRSPVVRRFCHISVSG